MGKIRSHPELAKNEALWSNLRCISNDPIEYLPFPAVLLESRHATTDGCSRSWVRVVATSAAALGAKPAFFLARFAPRTALLEQSIFVGRR